MSVPKIPIIESRACRARADFILSAAVEHNIHVAVIRAAAPEDP